MADDNADYAKQEYWDQRYATEPSYDWFGTVYRDCVQAAFESVEAVFEGQRAARGGAVEPLTVLHLGIGNSNLCEDLYAAYRAKYAAAGAAPPYQLVQVAVDYSPVVIENMRERYESTPEVLPDTHWVVADVRDLSEVRAAHGPCFDLVIDKATMDAFQAATGDDKDDNVAKMLEQVSECLTEAEQGGGVSAPARFRRFIQMTWEQPYFRLFHTTRREDRAYAWGTNATHRFLGDSDMYLLFVYDVTPAPIPV